MSSAKYGILDMFAVGVGVAAGTYLATRSARNAASSSQRATKGNRLFLCGPGFGFVGSSICGGPKIFVGLANICGVSYPTKKTVGLATLQISTPQSFLSGS